MVHLLHRFLGVIYHVDITKLDPLLLGEPYSREREFIRLRHKVKVLMELSPVSEFQKRFYRACSWSWKEYFFMGNSDSEPSHF